MHLLKIKLPPMCHKIKGTQMNDADELISTSQLNNNLYNKIYLRVGVTYL